MKILIDLVTLTRLSAIPKFLKIKYHIPSIHRKILVEQVWHFCVIVFMRLDVTLIRKLLAFHQNLYDILVPLDWSLLDRILSLYNPWVSSMMHIKKFHDLYSRSKPRLFLYIQHTPEEWSTCYYHPFSENKTRLLSKGFNFSVSP